MINILFFIQVSFYNLLSPISLVLLIVNQGLKNFKKYIFTIIISFLPLYFEIFQGLFINSYSAITELLLFLFYIYGFVSFNSLRFKLKKAIFYLNKKKFSYNLFMSLGIIFLYIFPYISLTNLYIFLLIVEFSKCLLLSKGDIKNSEIYKLIDFAPFLYLFIEVIFNKMDNTSSVIFVMSYIIAVIGFKIEVQFKQLKKLILNAKLKLFTIYILITSFFLCLILINFNDLIFYKFKYVYDSIQLAKEINVIDLENFYNFLMTRPQDSVAARLAEVVIIISETGKRYFGVKISSGTMSSSMAHATLATLLFKYKLKTIVMNLLLIINPINRQDNSYRFNHSYSLALIPFAILSFNNQGDFITALFLGFTLRALRDNICQYLQIGRKQLTT